MFQWLSSKPNLHYHSTLPSNSQSFRTASLLTMLQDCVDKSAVVMLLETNKSISPHDILQAALLLLSGEKSGLFGEWFFTIARVGFVFFINSIDHSLIHSIIHSFNHSIIHSLTLVTCRCCPARKVNIIIYDNCTHSYAILQMDYCYYK